MASYVATTSFIPNFFDDNGNLLSGGTLEAFIAGTSTPTGMFVDEAGTAAGTVITFNARGEPETTGNSHQVWIDGEIKYDFILKDSSGVTINTSQDVESSVSALLGSIAAVTTVAVAKGLTPLTDGQGLYIQGYTVVGDGGGGIYHYDASSTATANDGTILALDTLSGRLIYSDVAPATVKTFGIMTGGDHTAAIQSIIDAGLTGVSLAGLDLYYDGATVPDIFVGGGSLYSRLSDMFQDYREYANDANGIVIPVGFDWFTNNIRLEADGSASTDFDFEAVKFTPAQTRYIAIAGSNANDGLTVATAYRTVDYAISQTAGADTKFILVDDVFTKDDFNINAVTADRNMWFATLGSKKVTVWATDQNETWTKTAAQTYVYEATTGSISDGYNASHANPYGSPVYDTDIVDADGDYLGYTRVASIALCDSTPASWYFDGAIMYIHRLDGSAASAAIRVLRPVKFSFENGTYNVIWENTNFYGLEGVNSRCLIQDGNQPTVYASNCEFKYSQALGNQGGGGFRSEGGHTFAFNCLFARNRYDGANYHKWLDTGSGNLWNESHSFEMNCIGRNNGTTGDGNNQGSTSHDSCSAIRLNCSYYLNEGENLADVHSGTRSINLNVDVRDSLKVAASRHIFSGGTSSVGTKMYLANVKTSGRGDNDLVTDNGGEFYIFGCYLPRYSGANGLVKPWNPFKA